MALSEEPARLLAIVTRQSRRTRLAHEEEARSPDLPIAIGLACLHSGG